MRSPGPGDYQEAVRVSAEALSSLRKSIGDARFGMDGPKTTSFSVDTVYRSTQGGAPAFAGYRYSHGISITGTPTGIRWGSSSES